MSEMNKLSFVSQYGSAAHQEKVKPRADALIKHTLDTHGKGHDSDFGEDAEDVIKSGYVKGHDLDGFLHHHSNQFRRWAASNQNITKAHIDHIAAHGDYHQLHGLAWNTHVKLEPHHIDKMLDYKMQDHERSHPASSLAFTHPKDFSDANWKKACMHPNKQVAENHCNSNSAPMHHLLTAAVEHPDTKLVVPHKPIAATVCIRANRTRLNRYMNHF